MPETENSFDARAELEVGGQTFTYYSLEALQSRYDVARLPFSLKVLLENLLRNEDGVGVRAADVEALARWDHRAEPSEEIAFTPARVVMQDFTGVPCIVDLAAMRDAMAAWGADTARVEPQVPAELVIDHSVQVDVFGTRDAFKRNVEFEFERNKERYEFLKWGQTAFETFKVVPPGMGIVHQVNLEYLARVVFENEGVLYPDTLVGTDSHTTMINGLGVLGWGVGGIEAEAAMLGQPMSMLIPQVIGFKLGGELPEGATATDLVLTVTQMLREYGVVGKFVEFFGPGVGRLPLADRATLGNMSPEFGSTCAIFPIDAETLRYLEFSGRGDQVERVEAYARAQGLWHDDESEAPTYTDVIELDLSTVVPSLAGPKRPQDRVPLTDSKDMFSTALKDYVSSVQTEADEASAESFPSSDPPATNGGGGQENHAVHGDGADGGPSYGSSVRAQEPASVTLSDGTETALENGHVVIAAITSCTNTSNPSVMLGAGLLARKAREKGLESKPWVKTSLAPGSKVVTEYYDRAGLTEDLEALGFNLVGYGCTTCIGNSGPLPEEISEVVNEADLAVVSVLSGNRNFEGRINPDVKMNYLASPPLVVAYALAGTMDWDPYHDPFPGSDVMLKDIWPTSAEVAEVVESAVQSAMFTKSYDTIFEGTEDWQALEVEGGDRFEWDQDSTYVRRPSFLEDIPEQPGGVTDIEGARVLAKLGDSVTTDHISPAGAIKKGTPAANYLEEHGVERRDYNSYGSRRGNHEVMVRGTFANIRLRNQLAPGTEGGVTRFMPDGDEMPIYEAAMRYAEQGTPLIVIAGKEYGSGSSRDWAAKGTRLLGVRAVIAESYERIHRSNLVGMGVLPLQFADGEDAESLGLTGEEEFSITGLGDGSAKEVEVRAGDRAFTCRVRIDTPKEVEYFRHGGILPFVLRQLRDRA